MMGAEASITFRERFHDECIDAVAAASQVIGIE